MLQPQQLYRNLSRTAFFILFLIAPITDLFRYDLTEGHFILFGQPLGLGIDEAIAGATDTDAAFQILIRVLLPIVILVATGIWVAAKYGRLYCGWLCPHFSVVELINGLMQKLIGRPTVWEKGSKPHSGIAWLMLVCSSTLMALVWSIGLLGYLVPPGELYQDLLQMQLGGGSAIFISVATLVFLCDFLFARHLFCKFGCALGVMQSLLWMANPRALMVSFDSQRADLCKDCNSACDAACPMRLPARSIKRRKFTCTQCSECIHACNEVQKGNPEGGLLHWTPGDQRRNADRDRMIPVINIEKPNEDK
ncbi:4Fe-4S binding protein [Amphritea japonica]|uniref:Ferredoxin n=1 Tax=Amphritea japonica ATCC BAA-1530 TaxID=1278309 RepID=A0A7R6PEL1_9GAMM|nr:4Fe-4S binding protein [Amphritea japonica]BBB27666.1 ferredoxin [Amphritea japonica ATCC BAA-1530]